MYLSYHNLDRALQHYGLSLSSVDLVIKGYRNTSHLIGLKDDSQANLIVYKSEPGIYERIRRTNQLADFIGDGDLPIRTTLDARISQFNIHNKTYHVSLYKYLPGETIPWEAYTKKHIKLVGWALGEFHEKAREFRGELPKVSDEYKQYVLKMSKYFTDKNVLSAMRDKLGITPNIDYKILAKTIDTLSTLPNQQALHMDFVRGNILFAESKPEYKLQLGDKAISGIIDLEKASFGHPVWDIGRSLAFLMVDCSQPVNKIIKYFIASGYRKRGHQQTSLTSLKEVLDIFLVYDFYKFLRDNPYEDLSENHHYKKTRDILVASNMLYLAK